MRCPRCQAENREGRRFCAECGASLTLACPSCGFANEPGEKFCGGCGTSLAAAPRGPEPRFSSPQAYTPKHLAEKILKDRSALEGERRQVTVLFADLAGFTTLAEKLDPEEVHRLMDRCFEFITAEVHRFEGTINQYTGDGVMALFGAPIAHEDSPRRAVHAALGIQRALRDYSKELEAQRGPALRMRVGINTGPVVVGRIGDDLRMDYTAVGDTTNLAARLQQGARPGSVLVSDATHKLINGFFELLDLGEVPVKGRAPVRAYEVLRPRGRRARLDVAVERGLTPLVGRDRELATLRELFRAVKAGRGQVVFIAGEAGIGKSRVVFEFRRALAQAGEDATWLEGRCISFGHAIPFLPLLDQLRENFRIEEFDGEPEIIAKVEHGMRRMGGLEAHIPYLRSLLSVDLGDPAIATMEASVRRKRIFDAIRALTLRGANIRPVVLVFEDLHWVDTSTEEYLASLMDSVAAIPLMLILTYRMGYTPPFGTRSFSTTLTLRSLSEAESLAMAGRVLGTEHFPRELRAALVEKAEGVPLFVEEVTRTLLDLGVLRRENGGYRMVKAIAEVSVPDTIQAIIMARLDRLGEDGKRTVQLASVIGRQFMQRLLERIAGLTGQLEGLLRELKALEIIYEQALLPEPAYVFKHAMIQEVAYNSLLIQRRKELHKAVGYAIEDLYPDRLAERYEELAHHFFIGEEWQKALDYSVLAARRGTESFANREAKAHSARALECASKILPRPDPIELASLHEQHAAILTALTEYADAVAEYQEALDLTRQARDRRHEAGVLLGLCRVHHLNHRLDLARVFNEQALDIARELSDERLEAGCLSERAILRSIWSGEVREATQDAETALRLCRRIGDATLHREALARLGTLLQWRGDYNRGLAHLRKAFELAEAARDWNVMPRAAFFLTTACASKGEYEEAVVWHRRLRDYAFGGEDKFWMARSANLAGGIHLELFDIDTAIRLNLEGDEIAQKVYAWPEPRGHCLVKLSLAYLYRRDFEFAAESLDRACALLDKDAFLRWRWHIPLLRARGELALAEGHLEEAWSYATQSLEMARRTDSGKHVARAQWLQGSVLAASGRLDEAARVLEESVRLAERLQTPREIWMGKAALGTILARLGRDKEAEANLTQATRTIEEVAEKLRTPSLRESFLGAESVGQVYRALGRRPPHTAT